MAVSERTLVRLAWSTWAASIALLATGIAMLLTVRYGFPGSSAYDYWREATIVPAVYATLGLVVATRRPRHPVGWLLIGIGLTGSIQLVAGQYGAWAGAADLPGRLHAMWTAGQLQIIWIGLVLLLLLLFPTGRLPSPRWRPVAWALVAGVGLSLTTQALKPRTMSGLPEDTNPFGVPALEPIIGPLDVLGGTLVIVGIIGAFASLVVRLRRSRGRERQ
jgi:two-component system, NarL family, sensor kinase